jgi:hypothetical protein
MKVKDLIAALQIHDPESLVVLSSDEEGNSFSKASGFIDNGYYFAEIYDSIITRSEIKEDGTDVQILKNGLRIWP